VRKTPLTEENFEESPNCFLLQSSTIMSGKGLAVVCAVGENTCSGQASKALEDDGDSETPL
jgi:magnesium-transporting ATPase (P-type)